MRQALRPGRIHDRWTELRRFEESFRPEFRRWHTERYIADIVGADPVLTQYRALHHMDPKGAELSDAILGGYQRCGYLVRDRSALHALIRASRIGERHEKLVKVVTLEGGHMVSLGCDEDDTLDPPAVRPLKCACNIPDCPCGIVEGCSTGIKGTSARGPGQRKRPSCK
jgi:hypothetical protein